MSEEIFCIKCKRKLNPKTSIQIGINAETGKYTTRENLATQGFFDIGKDCLNSINPDDFHELENEEDD